MVDQWENEGGALIEYGMSVENITDQFDDPGHQQVYKFVAEDGATALATVSTQFLLMKPHKAWPLVCEDVARRVAALRAKGRSA